MSCVPLTHAGPLTRDSILNDMQDHTFDGVMISSFLRSPPPPGSQHPTQQQQLQQPSPEQLCASATATWQQLAQLGIRHAPQHNPVGEKWW
jgi:hypothetical protein